MGSIDDHNPHFRYASELVCYSSKNVFLTGRAGTGKTTFLKYIREHCSKQMAVLAPTGVAAINAGGVTIHSFFQLPFTPFLPDAKFTTPGAEASNKHSLLGRIRFNSERRRLIRELELLIIDEISMVRCDVLDAIDVVLRHTRNNYQEAFGGVQMLFIGDLYQLPPVAREPEWSLLSNFYNNAYFFSSKVLEKQLPVCIEFRKIYRQSEQDFIDLLNQVRNNCLDENGRRLLASRLVPDGLSHQKEGCIILTTHNEKARNINSAALANLPGKEFRYAANVENDFPEQSFPADAELALKVGAQVMFLKNDSESRRYFNGRIGVVRKPEKDSIVVSCKKVDGTEEDIEVGQVKWENIRYSLDGSNNQVKEEVLGSFSQFPLRLAWAITIHKSQGLTFEKAIIDAGASFSPGQVYVALSRCTRLDGMFLSSELKTAALATDQGIAEFAQRSCSDSALVDLVQEAKKEYQLQITCSLFDLKDAVAACTHLQDRLLKHSGSFNQETFTWCDQLLQPLMELKLTAEKFYPQLQSLFSAASPLQENQVLVERLKAAADYFSRNIDALLQHLKSCPAITDNRQLAKEFSDEVKEIFTSVSFKQYMLQGLSGRFDLQKYFLRKKSFTVPRLAVSAYSGSESVSTHQEHAALYLQLKKLRDSICLKKGTPAYMVLSSHSLHEMCTCLPQTTQELSQINGFGKVKLESYGQQFLSLVQQYATEKQLPSRMHLKVEKKKRKPAGEKKDTKQETLLLFRSKKAVSEIARERQLAVSTIEGHLSYFIGKGELDIADVLSDEKISTIQHALKNFDSESIIPVKQLLGDAISFGEIRMVLASVSAQKVE